MVQKCTFKFPGTSVLLLAEKIKWSIIQQFTQRLSRFTMMRQNGFKHQLKIAAITANNPIIR